MFGLVFPKWPWIVIPSVLSALLVGWLSITLHDANVVKLKEDFAVEKQAALDKLTEEMYADCKSAMKITEEVSREYQTNLRNLNKQLNSYRVRSQGVCVQVKSNSSIGSNGQTQPGTFNGQNSVSAWDIMELSGEGEMYRLQVIGLQDFIQRVWATEE